MSAALDYGVQDQVQLEPFDDNFFDSKQNIYKEDDNENNIEVDNNLKKNPFYVGTTPTSVSTMNDYDLYKNYKRAICICLKNNVQNTSNVVISSIYNKYITLNVYEELSNYFTLKIVSIKLLKNKFHRQTALLLDRNIISIFNNSNIELDGEEIIVPLFEIKENVIHLYNTMYESEYNINILSDLNTLYQYFDCNKVKRLILPRYSQIMNDISESNYWTNPYNCEINITKQFQERNFKLKERMPFMAFFPKS